MWSADAHPGTAGVLVQVVVWEKCGRVCGAGMGRGGREAILILSFLDLSSLSPITGQYSRRMRPSGELTSLCHTYEVSNLSPHFVPHVPPHFRLPCERSAHQAQGKRAGEDPPLLGGRVFCRSACRPFTACRRGAAGGT